MSTAYTNYTASARCALARASNAASAPQTEHHVVAAAFDAAILTGRPAGAAALRKTAKKGRLARRPGGVNIADAVQTVASLSAQSRFRAHVYALGMALSLGVMLTDAMLSEARAQEQTPPATSIRLPEVTVSGTREEEALVKTPASVGVINSEAVDEVKPTHPSQIISQVPGAAVSVTNGEGHTTAIRQPFTTDPVYLFLEDGVPTRSTGFFNHNGLYETNIPMAGSIEVTRGPGSALYGSDAIGGIINVLTRVPPTDKELSISAEGGSYGWWRLLGGGGMGYESGGWRTDLNVTHTDGWRDKTSYDRYGGNLRWDHYVGSGSSFKTLIGYSNIDQDTGANAPLPHADYKHNPKKNNHSIAFREVEAFRLSTTYEYESGNDLFSLIPYFRDNSMDLLASFRLAAPDPTVYTTENQSFGLMAKWRRDFPDAMNARVIAGVDIDHSPGSRDEDRIFTTSTGAGASRNFTSYTVGPKLYDYDVSFTGISPYLHFEVSPIERLRLTAGVRYDRLEYDFDNNLAGGTLLNVAGRFYGQADDTKVDFNRLTPKFGATWEFNPDMHGFFSYNRGFRAPSEGQLFRPAGATGASQAQALLDSALDLKPIKAEQFEIGLRGIVSGMSYNVALYNLEKKDDILSFTNTATNESQTVNAGKTRHRGIEIGLGAPLGKQWRTDVAFSYAKHKYMDWVVGGASAVDFSGNEIESAPRVISNTRLTWMPTEPVQLQLEWVRIGSYYMNAANTTKYSGHNLYNLRAHWRVEKNVSLFANIYNLGDTRYADSASISSNTPVYSPGLPRTYYAGVELKW